MRSHLPSLLFALAPALPLAFSALACGGNATSPSPDASTSGSNVDGSVGPGSSLDGSVGPGSLDASPPGEELDAGNPLMVVDSAAPLCPMVYDVYGDLDASDNLGNVNPTLYASGTCSGPIEQYMNVDAGTVGDGGNPAATDISVTLTQSAPRSGMFVTVIHQTTPFPFDYTTCLLSAGHGTGSSPSPGSMALVNDPEDESFPQVQLDTNMDGNDLVFDVYVTDTASFTLNTTHCTFTKN